MVISWYMELHDKDKQYAIDLIENDLLFFAFNEDNSKIGAFVVVNDCFVPAADFEDIDGGDLNFIGRLYEEFRFDGILAWVADKRKQEPLRLNEAYENAVLRLREWKEK